MIPEALEGVKLDLCCLPCRQALQRGGSQLLRWVEDFPNEPEQARSCILAMWR
jgi:hypothetical protein